MTNEGTTQPARSRPNRFFVLLLVLAALSGVVKDFERLHAVTRGIHGLTSSWFEIAPTVHAGKIPPAWTELLELKTINGGIDLDLPAVLNTQIEAETFNGSIDSEFPPAITERSGRKHVMGTIGGGGRGLQLKTLNGSIHLKLIG
jgi:hypothetical protein